MEKKTLHLKSNKKYLFLNKYSFYTYLFHFLPLTTTTNGGSVIFANMRGELYPSLSKLQLRLCMVDMCTCKRTLKGYLGKPLK